jgi:hypothetical protein
MNALTNVLEFVEDLNTASKITEGQYLDILNKLKEIHNSIPAPRVYEPPPIVRDTVPFHRQAPEPADSLSQYRETFVNLYAKRGYVSYDRLRSFLFGGVRHLNADFERLFFLCYNTPTPENVAAFKQAFEMPQTEGSVSPYRVGDEFIRVMSYMCSSLFKDADKRGAFLQLAFIRKSQLKTVMFKKQQIYNKMKFLPNDNCTIKEQQPLLTRLLHNCGVPLYNQFRVSRDEVIKRDTKKLHKIKLRIEDTYIDFDLYTDRVQLGRTCMSEGIYNLALCIYVQNIESERVKYMPIERFLVGINPLANVQKPPKLTTSGITASSRNKNRTYTYANNNKNEIVLTYDCKYNSK